MKLLFIYGPPAAGKLTVSTEIANRTGFRLFHNHLTVDAVAPVFEFGTEPFWRLVRLFRYETVTEAARRNVDLIYTFCYAKDEDDAHVSEFIELVESHGGEVCFVFLKCERAELDRRVVSESRARFGKVRSIDTLAELLDRHELFAPIPHRESLVIDTTAIPAADAATQIIEFYGL